MLANTSQTCHSATRLIVLSEGFLRARWRNPGDIRCRRIHTGYRRLISWGTVFADDMYWHYSNEGRIFKGRIECSNVGHVITWKPVDVLWPSTQYSVLGCGDRFDARPQILLFIPPHYILRTKNTLRALLISYARIEPRFKSSILGPDACQAHPRDTGKDVEQLHGFFLAPGPSQSLLLLHTFGDLLNFLKYNGGPSYASPLIKYEITLE